MTRPLRIQFAGALYHVTSRGDRKAAIFLDDTDRAVWLQTLGEVCEHFQFHIHAFCQMGNHYHLLVETAQANLSSGMRQLNSVYSQYFNRRRDLVGHVFQGRYHAILIDKEHYLLEVARYIVLNPVRAGIVQSPEDWPWSSYNLTWSALPPPSWLSSDWLLSRFGDQAQEAKQAYRNFVLAGMGGASPMEHLHERFLLGSEEFIQQLTGAADTAANGIPRHHRQTLAPPLHAYQQRYPDRDLAMAEAYRSRAYTLTEIARHFGVSHSTASRAAGKYRQQR